MNWFGIVAKISLAALAWLSKVLDSNTLIDVCKLNLIYSYKFYNQFCSWNIPQHYKIVNA